MKYPGEWEVRRCPYECSHSANWGAVCNSKQNSNWKAAGTSPLHKLIQLKYYCHCNGQHHHCCCCIRDPHREEKRGCHKPQKDSWRTNTCYTQNLISYSFVKLPPLHSQSHQETSHKEEYCIIKICCRHGLAIHNSQDGKERNRQQRGYGKRESLGYPPCCHKNCDSQCGGHLWVFRVNISKKEQEQCQHRNNYKTYNLFESQLVCQSSSNIQEFQK